MLTSLPLPQLHDWASCAPKSRSPLYFPLLCACKSSPVGWHLNPDITGTFTDRNYAKCFGVISVNAHSSPVRWDLISNFPMSVYRRTVYRSKPMGQFNSKVLAHPWALHNTTMANVQRLPEASSPQLKLYCCLCLLPPPHPCSQPLILSPPLSSSLQPTALVLLW